MKIICFSVPAMVLLLGGTGVASTIVQTQSATLLNVGAQFGVPIAVNPFNTALGTLNSITVDFGASFAGTVGVENVSGVPDMAAGIIGGSVTIANNGGSLFAQVFPSAFGAVHSLTAFDGTLDYGGTSGATDSVSGATATTSVTTTTAPALQAFTGTNEVFLTLTAKTFPIVQGMETESVTETANASATVKLTYDYTPAAAAPEPATVLLLSAGMAGLSWVCRRGRDRRW
ncbi:MAG: choice-of-anchor E domain-containing protein [Bryobacteraceae bacterium]